MKIPRAIAGAALAGVVLTTSAPALADKPADDFLNPQTMGPRLTFMPLIGPGLRVNYDHRFEIEQDISELRTQIIGDVVVPFSEVSANVDIRLFLLTFGASVGYHNEWHVLQFEPNLATVPNIRAGRDANGQYNQVTIEDPSFGKDTARGERAADPSGAIQRAEHAFTDLTRDARRVKDQNADVKSADWLWYEGRVGFIVPAQNFIAVTNAGFRMEDRPDMSYDWANGTEISGGMHLRWETFGLFRDREIGFIGPAVRVMNVPRHRVPRDIRLTVGTQTGRVLQEGDACQPGAPALRIGDQPAPGEPAAALRIPCEEVREWELHYGFVGGLRTNWVTSSDVFLMRVYTTYGMDNELFGLHLMDMPIQLLFAYAVDVDL